MISVKNIRSKSILVIGDVMLDVYYKGNVSRISPEAPVPVFNQENITNVLGGAANVASNLAAAGQKVSLMSIVGNDDNGNVILRLIEEGNIDGSLLYLTNRKTTTKTRFLATNNQQVMRLDNEDRTPIDYGLCTSLLDIFATRIKEYDIVIISDYMKGLLTFDLTQGIIRLCKKHNIPVIIDVKDTVVSKYYGATLLKPNQKELHDLTGCPVDNEEQICEAANKLRKMCNVKHVLCTCGAKGMILISDAAEPYILKAESREVFDVSGAGDTTIAYLSIGWANRLPLNESIQLANIAAGIQVGKVGTSSVSLLEIDNYLQEKEGSSLSDKIISKDNLSSFRNNHEGKKIVFTNGCFDILHIGHKRYLEAASKLGDLLVVGVNSDASVKRLKGDDRPINNEKDRVELLSAFGFIDYLVLFEEDTPYELIKTILPDVLVKGGDYKPENVVGKDIVESRGGKLVLIDYVEGKSTSNIIKIINDK